MNFESAQGNPISLQEFLEKHLTGDKIIYIGTDSEIRDGKSRLITGVALRIPRRGVNYIIARNSTRAITSLGEKLMREAMYSIEVAMMVMNIIKETDVEPPTIHVDVNKDPQYGSSKFANSIIGMVIAQGFRCEAKPDSWCASTLADTYCNGTPYRKPIEDGEKPRTRKRRRRNKRKTTQ